MEEPTTARMPTSTTATTISSRVKPLLRISMESRHMSVSGQTECEGRQSQAALADRDGYRAGRAGACGHVGIVRVQCDHRCTKPSNITQAAAGRCRDAGIRDRRPPTYRQYLFRALLHQLRADQDILVVRLVAEHITLLGNNDSSGNTQYHYHHDGFDQGKAP